MAIPTFYDYKGYRIAVTKTDVRVATRDLTIVYKTTSLDKATRWIDAYRDGVQWAVNEAIGHRQRAYKPDGKDYP